MPRKLQYNYLRHALFNLQSAPTVVDVGSACLVPVDQLQRQPDPTADEDMQLSDDYTGGGEAPLHNVGVNHRHCTMLHTVM